MSSATIPRLGAMHSVKRFREHLGSAGLSIPCDSHLIAGSTSPLAQPLERGGIQIGNRIAVQPMEGWDSTTDGGPRSKGPRHRCSFVTLYVRRQNGR